MTEAHALRNPAMRPSVRQSIRQSTRASRARGFTLVEVIVALAILSLVMLATVSGFRTLGNTATTISRMTDRSDELRSVSSFLRDAFENSVTGEGPGESASDGCAVVWWEQWHAALCRSVISS